MRKLYSTINLNVSSADEVAARVAELKAQGYKEWVYAEVEHLDLFPRRRRVTYQHVWLVPAAWDMPTFNEMCRFAGGKVRVEDRWYGTVISGRNNTIVLIPEDGIAVINTTKINIHEIRERIQGGARH
ncbi:MAG: hypothetical protein D6790_20310 [Caldilineae bacterium]|nr:MAG: hypothetical protein D6790_20310 [Caldilineae bacterium]